MVIGVEVKEPRDKLPREKSLSLSREREREGETVGYMGWETHKKKRKKERDRGGKGENGGERSGVTFLIVSRPAAFCFGVYAS